MYNLSTEGGWYVSSGIITHNCDCAIVPSWAGSGVAGYDPKRYADLFNGARDWLRSEDAPEELVRRVRRDRSKPGYTESFNGVLAAMRARYGLK